MLGWNYSRGTYCVTICTHERICWLGEVAQGEVVLSDIGRIVAEEWEATSEHHRTVILDAWIVMPNHLHGILHLAPLLPEKAIALGKIVGLFKSACSRRIWSAGHQDFKWQSRFYDQVIRDEEMLLAFRRYISENPLRWSEDRCHSRR
jgi:REP element-mobilizing transposase RayT